jgi:hypothetical protein
VARDVEFDVLGNDKSDAALRSAERNLKRFGETTKRESDKLGSGIGDGLVKGVSKVSPKLGAAVAEGLAAGAKAGAPLIASGVAAATPLVAGLMSAAVLGGAGLGGIAGGVILASRDVRVKSAADDLGKTVGRSLDKNAGVFVEPTLRSIDIIKDKFVELDPVLASVFRNSARYVEPLADAATDAVGDIVKGADTAIRSAEPVMREINDGIRGTGRTVRGFFEDMSSDGEQSAANLESAFDTINGTLALTGDAVRIINRTFAELDQIMPLSALTTLNRLFGETEEGARRTGSGTFGAAEGINAAGDAAEESAGQTKSLVEQQRDATNAAQGLYGAQTSAAEAIARSTKIIDENGRGLSLNSEKGRENRGALSGVASALSRQYDAYVAVNGAGADADAVAASNRASFIRLATAATGSSRQARILADELLGIPKNPTSVIKADTAAANAAVDGFQSNLNGIDRNVTVTITTRYRGDGSNQNSPSIGGGGGRTFDAGDYWRAVDQARGDRVAPPTPVALTSSIRVDLDGRPFRQQTVEVVNDSQARERWRSRYGGRN